MNEHEMTVAIREALATVLPSRRERIATAAMQALLNLDFDRDPKDTAHDALLFADALIAALDAGEKR